MQTVTVTGKGGRPKIDSPEDPLRLRTVLMPDSQWQWLKGRPGGAGAVVRALVKREMARVMRAMAKSRE